MVVEMVDDLRKNGLIAMSKRNEGTKNARVQSPLKGHGNATSSAPWLVHRCKVVDVTDMKI